MGTKSGACGGAGEVWRVGPYETKKEAAGIRQIPLDGLSVTTTV